MNDPQGYTELRNKFHRVLAQLVLDCREGKHIGMPSGSAYNSLCATTEGQGALRLFKYSGADEAKNIERRLTDIETGRLHLSAPSSFNDPFDANPFFDTGTFGSQVEASLLPERVERYRELLVKAGADERLVDAVYNALSNEPSRKAIVEWYADTLVQATPPSFAAVRARVRIACMCEAVDKVRMWAGYASNGRGFATEYQVVGRKVAGAWFREKTKYGMTGFTLIPVQYTGRFDVSTLAPLFIADGFQTPAALAEPEYLAWVCSVAYKTSEWRNEAEWRLACSAPVGIKEQMYALLEPNALYVGWQTDKRLVQRLRELANRKGISLYRVLPDESSREGKLVIFPDEA